MNTHHSTHHSHLSERLGLRAAGSDLAPAAVPDTRRTSEPHQPAAPDRARPARRRLVKVAGGVGFVVVWLLLGSALALGFVGLLLLGALLLVTFQATVRRHPLRMLVARDTVTFARRWPGKLLVATVLVIIPATLLLLSLRGGRYVDDSWKALLMLAALAVAYLVSRRLLLTVLIGAVTIAVVSWVLAPNLANTRNGDPTVLAHLDHEAGKGMLDGLHDVAVAEVDMDARQQVRLAGIGADNQTPMEVGSLTKALTGLVLADAVRRGEIRMDAPVSTYLPALKNSPAGAVTMQELVTHTAGYSAFGADTLRRAGWKSPLGQGFLTADSTQMTQETRSQTLPGRGHYAYSTLGAATAGQAAAAAAHMSYADLMRTRLFEPLGMMHTAIESDHALVAGGRSETGLPVQPWVMDAYAPGGAAVSTTGDLAKLATALLDGSAPGMSALTPTTVIGQSNSRIGDFWMTSTWQGGQTITWHNGQTGGYTSYLGLDLAAHRAVIVLADVANPITTDLGSDLLADLE